MAACLYVHPLTSSPFTDSTLRLFFILIGSFWAPGRSVPEPRQQSRWRARTGGQRSLQGETGVRPVTAGPHLDLGRAKCLALRQAQDSDWLWLGLCIILSNSIHVLLGGSPVGWLSFFFMTCWHSCAGVGRRSRTHFMFSITC